MLFWTYLIKMQGCIQDGGHLEVILDAAVQDLCIFFANNVSTHDFTNNDVAKLKTDYLLIL